MNNFEMRSDDYIAKHNTSLVAGTHDEFRRQKIAWVREIVSQVPTTDFLDFGFGAGELLEDLRALHMPISLYGVEPGHMLRDEFLARHAKDPVAQVAANLEEVTDCSLDVISCFNVLHHIPPTDRPAVAAAMLTKLRPGGRVLIWEHNPYNPATQYIVGRCEYDDDAILLTRSEARRLFSHLTLESSAYLNVTPPSLQKYSLFRGLETFFDRLPIGAQYRLILRKPS
jgi:SAM-dependent methyltransferase